MGNNNPSAPTHRVRSSDVVVTFSTVVEPALARLPAALRLVTSFLSSEIPNPECSMSTNTKSMPVVLLEFGRCRVWRTRIGNVQL